MEWNELPRAKQIKIRRKFVAHMTALTNYLTTYVGLGNYAGDSSLNQLSSVEEKFLECTPVRKKEA